MIKELDFFIYCIYIIICIIMLRVNVGYMLFQNDFYIGSDKKKEEDVIYIKIFFEGNRGKKFLLKNKM